MSRRTGSGAGFWLTPEVGRLRARPGIESVELEKSRGSYRFQNVVFEVQAGQLPKLLFLDESGEVPQSLREDQATKVWLDSEALPSQSDRGLSAALAGLERDQPATLFLRLGLNPAHVLEDCLFSIALETLGPASSRPAFERCVSFEQHQRVPAWDGWARFVFAASGMIRPEAESNVKVGVERTLFPVRELVVPKFMRHRFAYAWEGLEIQKPAYIDTSGDYPLEVLAGLQARLFESCFGVEVRARPRSQGKPRLLLYDRGDAARRRWSNSVSGYRYLKQHFGGRFDSMAHISGGFAELSPSEQAELFYGADVVIAPHGAALANLIFCRPGTRILELGRFSKPWGWSSFSQRLGMRHQQLHAVDLKMLNQETFEVDPAELVAAVEELLNPPRQIDR